MENPPLIEDCILICFRFSDEHRAGMTSLEVGDMIGSDMFRTHKILERMTAKGLLRSSIDPVYQLLGWFHGQRFASPNYAACLEEFHLAETRSP